MMYDPWVAMPVAIVLWLIWGFVERRAIIRKRKGMK